MDRHGNWRTTSPTIPTCAASMRQRPPAARSGSCGARRVPIDAKSSSRRVLLAVAGLLEAAGPIFGKRFIDDYLLPRNGRRGRDRAAARRLSRDRLGRHRHPLLPARAARRTVDALGAAACARASTRHVLRAADELFRSRDHRPAREPHHQRHRGGQGSLHRRCCSRLLVGLTVLFGVVVAMLWLDWRLMLIVLLLVPATIGIVWRLPAPVGGRGDARARAAQRHQRPDGRRHRRHERAAGRGRDAPLRRALRPHQRRALPRAPGRGARQRMAAASRARLRQRPADRRASSRRSARSSCRASRSASCTRSSPTSRASWSR